MAATSPFELFGSKFSHEAAEALRERYDNAPKAPNQDVKLEFFLGLAEKSPQAPPCLVCPETEKSHVLDLLAKLALYAPEVWFEIVTGQKCPADAKNDYPHIGVAFDASSRIRRAGIEFYHAELTRQWLQRHGGHVPICYVPLPAKEGGVKGLVDAKSWKELHASAEVPAHPGGQCVRVVAISDTHLLENYLTDLPQGDLLLHCGDLSYEESRSQDARMFEERWKKLGEKFEDFVEWFETSKLAAADALKWLGSQQFEHKVFVAGNHDFILEQMGPQNAERLCKAFGIDHYLFATAAPVELTFKSDCKVKVWGSAVSAKAGLGANRAILSGNMSYVLDTENGDAEFRAETKHLEENSADIMVTHGPPEGKLYGKSGKVLSCISELVSRVRPHLFLCGHEHNPDNWKVEQKVVNLDQASGPGILGVHCACAGTWNHFSGMPFVVDVPARSLKESSGDQC